MSRSQPNLVSLLRTIATIRLQPTAFLRAGFPVGDLEGAGNGGTIATSAFTQLGTNAQLNIGNSNGSALFGTIRNVRIYPVALQPAKLITKTSAATDWLGDPWWTIASTDAANDSTYRIAANS